MFREELKTQGARGNWLINAGEYMSFLQDLLGEAYKEGMSEEELSAALEQAKVGKAENASEIEKLKAEIQKTKETLSKKNSEAAQYKKQYESYLSEEERKKQETEQRWAEIEQENKSLKREKSIAEFTAQYLGMGYDAELAKSTAEAMTDGDIAKVMLNQAAFTESMKKQIKAELMRGNPDPVGGKSESAMTLEKLRAMSIEDRYAFSQDHPDEYAQLYEKEK